MSEEKGEIMDEELFKYLSKRINEVCIEYRKELATERERLGKYNSQDSWRGCLELTEQIEGVDNLRLKILGFLEEEELKLNNHFCKDCKYSYFDTELWVNDTKKGKIFVKYMNPYCKKLGEFIPKDSFLKEKCHLKKVREE